jgi:hypothetical protein
MATYMLSDEMSFNTDGIRHMKKDHLAEKEYRYGCSVDCGGTPLRVYARELGSQGSWNSYEDYLNAPTFVWYNNSDGSSSDYAWLPGHWFSEQQPPGEGSMYYQDAFGVHVAGDFSPPQQEPPEIRSHIRVSQMENRLLWLAPLGQDAQATGTIFTREGHLLNPYSRTPNPGRIGTIVPHKRYNNLYHTT